MISKILKFFVVLAGLGAIGGVIALGVIFYVSFDLPQINSLADYNPPIPSRILSKDGEILLEMAKERREIAQFDEIPQRIIDAFLAAEDDNFYNHTGIDYTGIARAMVINIKAGRIVQGASTITQQVAKSLLLTSERTFTRKIKDLLLAKRIEEKFSKDEILFLYLNQVYLGGGYYGVKKAFDGYFGKKLSQATVAESALVAGLLVAPGKYSPYVNPEYAKTRQKYVLGRLLKTQKISQIEYENAMSENIRLMLRKTPPQKAGYFTDWIRQRVMNEVGVEEFLTNGFEVVTTINWDLQKKAEESVLNGIKEIDKRQGFSGPIGFVEKDKLLETIKEIRQKTYKNESEFFTFFSDSSVEYEYSFDQAEVEKLFAKEQSFFESLMEDKTRARYLKKYNEYFEVGQDMNDPFMKFLKVGKNYEAIVTKISDYQRMIYVTIGGLKAVIPYEHFRWAHERDIREEPKYWGYVTRPSSIVKEGDVLNVKLMSQPRGIWEYIYTDFKKLKSIDPLFSDIQKQKYYVAMLDQEPKVQGALLSISPHTGEIIAMVGGSDFEKSKFNRVVQSNRQPGSAFKPMVYALALENGYTPATILLDSPQALAAGEDQQLNWKPRNYDGKFQGQMTFRRALEISRNIPTIKVLQDVGIDKMTDFVKRIGIDIDMPKDLSSALGSFGINLLEMVRAYAIFPNGGKKVALRSIVSIKDRFGTLYHLSDQNIENKGNMPEAKVPEVAEKASVPDLTEAAESTDQEKEKQNPFLVNLNEEQVYDNRLSYIVSNLLKGVVAHGSGVGAKSLGPFIGGKTGTTSNFNDAWFLGFSSSLVTGAWVGFDDNTTMGYGESGGRSALPIWKDYMEAGLKVYGESDFPIPTGIINVTIDKESGRLADSSSSNAFIEAFVEGTEPGSENERQENSDKDISETILDDEGYFTAH